MFNIGGYSSSRHSYDRVPTEDTGQSSESKVLKSKISEQDEHLNILESSIQRLGKLGMSISDELKDQNKMLDSLDADTDHAQTQVELITQKTKELIRKSGGPKYFTAIVVLTIILIILIFLVIYT